MFPLITPTGVILRTVCLSHSLPMPLAHHLLQWTSTWHIRHVAERQEDEWYFYFSHQDTKALWVSWTRKKKKEKKTRKCVCNCEQHMFIDSMGQGLSAATHQFSNCLILLTCVSVCVYVGECASVHACWLLFFLKKCQCLLWLLCTTDLLYWQISCIWLSVMFMMNLEERSVVCRHTGTVLMI